MSKDSKSVRIQSRNFSCVSYLSVEQIHDVFSRKANQIAHYAYITHDKDVNSDGQPKETHTHIIVCLVNNVNLTTFENWFKGYTDIVGKPVNTFVETVKSVTSMYEYLTHKNDPEKYQYKDTDIVATDHSYFTDNQRSESDPVFMWVEMLLNGTSLREVAKIGGRDFIYHYSAVRVLLNDIREEEERAMQDVNQSFYRGDDINV